MLNSPDTWSLFCEFVSLDHQSCTLRDRKRKSTSHSGPLHHELLLPVSQEGYLLVRESTNVIRNDTFSKRCVVIRLCMNDNIILHVIFKWTIEQVSQNMKCVTFSQALVSL